MRRLRSLGRTLRLDGTRLGGRPGTEIGNRGNACDSTFDRSLAILARWNCRIGQLARKRRRPLTVLEPPAIAELFRDVRSGSILGDCRSLFVARDSRSLDVPEESRLLISFRTLALPNFPHGMRLTLRSPQ